MANQLALLKVGFPVLAAASDPPAARLTADEGAAGRTVFDGWIGCDDFDPPIWSASGRNTPDSRCFQRF
jgi:hypothetical protein